MKGEIFFDSVIFIYHFLLDDSEVKTRYINTAMKLNLLEEKTKKIHLSKERVEKIISPSLKTLGNIFFQNGYDIRVVGGAVRDIIKKETPNDIDLSTTATPDEMKKLFKKNNIKYILTGIEHGTITVIIDSINYEITTLRIDKNTDGRRAEVEFTDNWKEDMARRDLTFNALSMDFKGVIYDYFGGIEDLKNKESVFVGNVDDRLEEDFLRILRYFRFQGRLKKPRWNSEVLRSMEKHAKNLQQISGERISTELMKILSNPNTRVEVLKMMDKTGVYHYSGLSQRDFSKLEDLETGDPVVALAAITKDESDLEDIRNRWKFSNSVFLTVEYILKYRKENFDIKLARKLITEPKASRERITSLAKYHNKLSIMDEMKKQGISDFPVSGKDLIAAGVKPGPEMGKILQNLRRKWQESDYKLSKDDLIGRLQ